MPRKWLRRLLPTHQQVRETGWLRRLGRRLHDPNLWHLNRRSVSWGAAIGIFFSFFPFFGQSLLAALLAIYLRVNLPLSLVFVWITNPITAAPLFYFAYLVGTRLLGRPMRPLGDETSLRLIIEQIGAIWQPLLLGCLVVGLLGAAAGFFIIRLLWRWYVTDRWQRRSLPRNARR